MALQLETKAKITWCPGCTNNQILVAFRQAVDEMVADGKFKPEELAVFAGIGCHGKISDYLNLSSFTSLHGRVIPAMTGAKLANPSLQIAGFSGDGDSFAEGMEHLMHAARRNSDINLFVHDNQVFALTTGQATPVSPKGFKGKSTPTGSIEEPFNPILAMLAMGATFVARTYAGDMAKTKEIMKAAFDHKGFSFVDIIQPCISFFDTRDALKDKLFWLDDKFPTDNIELAMLNARAKDEKMPLGIFYRVSKPTFEEQVNG